MDFISSPDDMRPDDVIMSYADGEIEIRVVSDGPALLRAITFDFV